MEGLCDFQNPKRAYDSAFSSGQTWLNIYESTFCFSPKKHSYEFHISTSHIYINCVCTHLNWTCFILSWFQFRWFHGGSVSGVPSFYPVLAGRSEENLERLPLAEERNETYQATMFGLENDLLSNCMHDQKYSPRTGLLTPRAIVTCLYSSLIFNLFCIKIILHVPAYMYICILNNVSVHIWTKYACKPPDICCQMCSNFCRCAHVLTGKNNLATKGIQVGPVVSAVVCLSL